MSKADINISVIIGEHTTCVRGRANGEPVFAEFANSHIDFVPGLIRTLATRGPVVVQIEIESHGEASAYVGNVVRGWPEVLEITKSVLYKVPQETVFRDTPAVFCFGFLMFLVCIIVGLILVDKNLNLSQNWIDTLHIMIVITDVFALWSMVGLGRAMAIKKYTSNFPIPHRASSSVPLASVV